MNIVAFPYINLGLPLRKKCPYSEFFWSLFSRIRTEYGEIRSIFNQTETDICSQEYMLQQMISTHFPAQLNVM